MTLTDEIKKATAHLSNIEFLDFDSLKVTLTLRGATVECLFNGFEYVLETGHEPRSMVARIFTETSGARVEFDLGYNPDTKKPQLGWHAGHPPMNVDLRVATDTVVGMLFAVCALQGIDLEIFPRLEPRRGGVRII